MPPANSWAMSWFILLAALRASESGNMSGGTVAKIVGTQSEIGRLGRSRALQEPYVLASRASFCFGSERRVIHQSKPLSEIRLKRAQIAAITHFDPSNPVRVSSPISVSIPPIICHVVHGKPGSHVTPILSPILNVEFFLLATKACNGQPSRDESTASHQQGSQFSLGQHTFPLRGQFSQELRPRRRATRIPLRLSSTTHDPPRATTCTIHA